jgi:hypothetical protein
MALGSSAAVPQSDETTESLPTLPPLHRIAFPADERIVAAVFSSDGTVLRVVTDRRAVNVWALGIYYWPEILGCLSGIAAVVCIRKVLSVRRNPQIVGAPHCRNCNYCLAGLVSDRCPECGALKKRFRSGKTAIRRALPFVVALLGVAIP